MTLRPCLALLAGTQLLVGCARAPIAPSQPPPQRIDLVDTLPPASARLASADFTPRWFHDDSYLTNDPEGRPGRVLRNVAVVSFRPEASPGQRRAALSAVHGTVVGGSEPTGAYYIKLPEAGQPISPDSLGRVLAMLEALPQVDSAGAYGVSPGNAASLR
jgi:hypothetical protein